MDAKISITVHIEDIPRETAKLLYSNHVIAENIVLDLKELERDVGEETDLLKQIEKLDAVRKKMSWLDLKLEDCYTILVGYAGYKTSLLEKPTKETIDVRSDTTKG